MMSALTASSQTHMYTLVMILLYIQSSEWLQQGYSSHLTESRVTRQSHEDEIDCFMWNLDNIWMNKSKVAV